MLAGNLLLARQDGFSTAQVDDPAALVAPLHNTGDNLAHAILEFLIDDFLLGVAHALNNHLLGGLGGNAPQVFHLDAETHFVVQLHRGIMFPGLAEGYLHVLVGNVVVLHNQLVLIDVDVARIIIIGNFHIHIFAEAAQYRGAHGIFQRIDKHVAIETLVLADLVNGLLEFKVHDASRCRARGVDSRWPRALVAAMRDGA